MRTPLWSLRLVSPAVKKLLPALINPDEIFADLCVLPGMASVSKHRKRQI